MRTGAGLSQRALAKKVGTSASAINRLEFDDYQGYTIAMVRRIATALNRQKEVSQEEGGNWGQTGIV
jgi:transcriptional regulator with XRE-family HTH domain